MAKPGPKSKAEAIDLAKVEEFAAMGLTQEAIARLCGYNAHYFYTELKSLNPAISDALSRGRAKNQLALLDRLQKRAQEDQNPAALFFALKAIHKFRDAPTQVELSGPDGAPVEIEHSALTPIEAAARRAALKQKLLALEESEDE